MLTFTLVWRLRFLLLPEQLQEEGVGNIAKLTDGLNVTLDSRLSTLFEIACGVPQDGESVSLARVSGLRDDCSFRFEPEGLLR